jgi:hypothetical protein
MKPSSSGIWPDIPLPRPPWPTAKELQQHGWEGSAWFGGRLNSLCKRQGAVTRKGHIRKTSCGGRDMILLLSIHSNSLWAPDAIDV